MVDNPVSITIITLSALSGAPCNVNAACCIALSVSTSDTIGVAFLISLSNCVV